MLQRSNPYESKCCNARAGSALTTLSTLALLAQMVYAADTTLGMPHALRSGETAWLEVKVGAISKGDEIEVETPAGRFLGVISPFGIRGGHDAGTYTLPIPVDVILNDRVTVRVFVKAFGQAQRTPTKNEVKSLIVKIVGPTR